MDKVAVRKAVGVQYPVTGAPILVTGGGGRGRGAVGVTRRQRALGMLGGAVGALGALTGQHRSLGGLVQSAISGGAQGSALGRGAGRALTSRARQARADREEGIRQQYAARQAAGDMGMFQGRRRFGRTVGTAGRDPTIMENQMRYVDRERAEAAAQQRAQPQFEAAANRARGADFGAEDARYAQVGRNVGDMMGGMDLEEMERRSAQAMAARPSGNVGVADFTPTDATGRPVPPEAAAAIPQLGQGSAVDEINDIENASEKEAVTTGTDHDRRSTVAVMPSRPTEEEEDDGEMSAAQRDAMRRNMMGRPGEVAVRSNTRQTNIGEF